MTQETVKPQQEQDDEITAFEYAEWALEELRDELAGKLSAELAALNEPLAQEAAQQDEKARTLRESYEQLKPRAEAQQRLFAGEIDKALAEGRDHCPCGPCTPCAGRTTDSIRLAAIGGHAAMHTLLPVLVGATAGQSITR